MKELSCLCLQFTTIFLSDALLEVHKVRAKTLVELSQSLLNDADLSLTSLGRYLDGKTAVKHKIKRVNDFLGNLHIHNETTLKCHAKSFYKGVYLYKKRMQIEQNFRDDKSPRFSFSWRHSRSKDKFRISTLYLIACVASFLLWMIGFIAESKKIHYTFQANTTHHRRVLSFLFLAKQIIRHTPYLIKLNDLFDAITLFQLEYFNTLAEEL